MKDDGKRLLAQARGGDQMAFARLLSWLEANGPAAAFAVPELLNPPSVAFRFGVTGPPGAGKSTLVGGLIRELRTKKDFKIGVIAVDPSSPFTRGAILGDRVRYSEHFMDEKVFIRSLGTRGSLGGLSASSYLMLRAFDVCGFDAVLVETVGVGQTELEILHVADKVAVVLVPESGDAIQAMKAGLMEIADLFVVNKADRPGAAALVRELKLSTGVRVVSTIATEGEGLDAIFDYIVEQAQFDFGEIRWSADRLQEEARALLRAKLEETILETSRGVKSPDDLKRLF